MCCSCNRKIRSTNMENKPIWEALAQRNYNSYGKIHIYSSNTIKLNDINSFVLTQFTTFRAKENIPI